MTYMHYIDYGKGQRSGPLFSLATCWRQGYRSAHAHGSRDMFSRVFLCQTNMDSNQPLVVFMNSEICTEKKNKQHVDFRVFRSWMEMCRKHGL